MMLNQQQQQPVKSTNKDVAVTNTIDTATTENNNYLASMKAITESYESHLLPFYESPMGLIGQIQGFITCVGYYVHDDIVQYYYINYGIQPVLTGMILFGSLFFLCFLLIVLIALYIPVGNYHDKQD